MLFSSPSFIYLFLPLVAALFLRLMKTGPAGRAILFVCGASLVFYGWREPIYLPLLLGTLLVNFGLGKWFRSLRRQKKDLSWPLAAAVVFNLLPLAFFKYGNFISANLNEVFSGQIPLLQLSLPLAISFYTFQMIAYLVDCCREEVPDYSFREYLYFVVFFPQLIAGPIVHHYHIVPQIRELGRKIDWEMVAMGAAIFFFGLFKKLALADPMGEYADLIFNQLGLGRVQTMGESWMGAIAYSLQIYFDFSAYSDMAIGIAAIFQIRMILNFASPYQSTSITEFWRRWHISLSEFLKCYLYIPLGGNRKGRGRTYLNLIVTMLLGGLWHGAGWTFVVWGFLHGISLAIHKFWRTFRPAPRKEWPPFRELKKICIFLLVTVFWVFFRAESFAHAGEQLGSMFGHSLVSLPRGLESFLPWLKRWGVVFSGLVQHQNKINNIDLLKVGAVTLIALYGPNLQSLMSKHRLTVVPGDVKKLPENTWGFSWAPNIVWAALSLATVALCSWLVYSDEKAFIYFKF